MYQDDALTLSYAWTLSERVDLLEIDITDCTALAALQLHTLFVSIHYTQKDLTVS